jgi:uncharacterized protein with FMN-binding domain
MKRVIAAASLTIAGLSLVLGFKTRGIVPAAATDIAEPAVGTTTAETVATTTPTPTTTGNTGTGTSTTAAPSAPTTAGTVEATGPTVNTPYGPVQVAVTVGDGTLVDVIPLQLPGGNRESDAINAYAAPLLEEMALEAQSAQIDVVSGATFTSLAYTESLQAALDQAGM